jgi:hypothetical protein
LKFNRSFEKSVGLRERIMRIDALLLRRSFRKLALDIVPAALASVVGGMVLGQHHATPATPVMAHAAPASVEMMALLRDEHAVLAAFLEARLAKEKQELVASESAPHDRGRQVPAGVAALLPVATAAAMAKPVAPRDKAPAMSPALAPLVIARAEPIAQPQPNVVGASAAKHDWLLAQTVGLKDHVVAAAQRAVSVIAVIPSWIGTIGERIGGENIGASPVSHAVSAS